MKKTVLRLVMRSFIAHLSSRFLPVGQPCLHDLEARLTLLISAIPENGGPEIGDPHELGLAAVTGALEWLVKTLADAAVQPGDSWAPLACQLLRLEALSSAEKIHARLMDPGKSLDSCPPVTPMPIPPWQSPGEQTGS